MSKKAKSKKFVSFDDTTVPIGERKVAYVKWLMQKRGYSLQGAKLAAYKKFYHEEHG